MQELLIGIPSTTRFRISSKLQQARNGRFFPEMLANYEFPGFPKLGIEFHIKQLPRGALSKRYAFSLLLQQSLRHMCLTVNPAKFSKKKTFFFLTFQAPAPQNGQIRRLLPAVTLVCQTNLWGQRLKVKEQRRATASGIRISQNCFENIIIE